MGIAFISGLKLRRHEHWSRGAGRTALERSQDSQPLLSRTDAGPVGHHGARRCRSIRPTSWSIADRGSPALWSVTMYIGSWWPQFVVTSASS